MEGMLILHRTLSAYPLFTLFFSSFPKSCFYFNLLAFWCFCKARWVYRQVLPRRPTPKQTPKSTYLGCYAQTGQDSFSVLRIRQKLHSFLPKDAVKANAFWCSLILYPMDSFQKNSHWIRNSATGNRIATDSILTGRMSFYLSWNLQIWTTLLGFCRFLGQCSAVIVMA